jgi:hypothetical protein
MLTCDVCNSPSLAPRIASRPMKKKCLCSYQFADFSMYHGGEKVKRWWGRIEKSCRKCFDSDNECRDFSEDETESEVSSIGSDDESSEEDSDEKNDDAPGPSKRVRTMTQLNRVTGSGPKLTTILYLPLYQKQWNLWWLIVKIWSRTTIWTLYFLEYMEPLFEKNCDETNEYARVQLNNPNRK